jgi:hypothetical protein
LIASATFFSKFESTLTEYQRIAIVVVRTSTTGRLLPPALVTPAQYQTARRTNRRACLASPGSARLAPPPPRFKRRSTSESAVTVA